MKLLFSVLCIVAVINGYIQDNKNNEEIVEKCAKKTQATEDDVEAIMNDKISQSRTSQCFAACWMKESEIMTPDNKMNVAKIKEILDIEEMKKEDVENYNITIKVLEKCSAEVIDAADECAAAKKFLECRKREDI